MLVVGRYIIRNGISGFKHSREFHATPCVYRVNNYEWNEKHKLPQNPTLNPQLLHLPDYTFDDGRPTPYSIGQRRRIAKQQLLREKIMGYLEMVDYGKEAYKKKCERIERSKVNYIGRKLRAKGPTLLGEKAEEYNRRNAGSGDDDNIEHEGVDIEEKPM